MTEGNEYPIVRYHFEAVVNTPLGLPFYSGSMLRGAFGHALRHISCMTKLKDCNACPIKQTCPYTIVFEPSVREVPAIEKYTQLPALYVIEPPQQGQRVLEPGETLAFSMVLIGEVRNHLPLIILAWQRALLRGLTSAKSRLTLTNVSIAGEKNRYIWSEDAPQIKPHQQHLTVEPNGSKNIQLSIVTPMRLQRKGKTVSPDDANPLDLFAALLRRLTMIEQVCQLPISHEDVRADVEQARNITSNHQLKWTDWERYSHRQKQKMALGGLTGTWTLTGELMLYQKALYLGQWLHVGKNTSFGMGCYRLENLFKESK